MLNFFIFLTIAVSSVLTEESCLLNTISNSLIVVDKTFKVRLPDHSGLIHFKPEEIFFIQCPQGSTNPLISDDGEKASCQSGTKIQIERTGLLLDFSQLQCMYKLPSTTRKSHQPCESVGTQFEVGFEIHDHFAPAYSVCLDEKLLAVLSAKFNASFAKWGPFQREILKHDFIDNGHSYGYIDVNGIYGNQKEIVKELGVEEYITRDIYLVPGQLVPEYVFSYPLEREASFDFLNSVPTWSSLDGQFAEFVNVVISGYQLNPQTYYVGTTGVATLPNPAGAEVELYLYEGKVPVPRWLWFGFEGTFYIYGYNNPYFEASEAEAEFKELCEQPYTFITYNDTLVGICDDEVTSN